MSGTSLESKLQAGAWKETFQRLYGNEQLDVAQARCAHALQGFADTFGTSPEALFSAPGRTELGGNHTDHQHGCVLAASVDLDILAAVAPNQSGILRIQSEGYPLLTIDLQDLLPHSAEVNTSAALVRGVAARMQTLGCPLQAAGLDAYITSNVPGGSGLSSSAAFEVLIGTIFNDLFWNGHCTPVELAQIGQYAENVYFGKPCGLMDQMAAAVGGVVAIDFADAAHPKVEQIHLDLQKVGYALCILDAGADHADLTVEYAAITEELKAVCTYFGTEVLREVPEELFFSALPQLRQTAGDRAVLRAIHFYAENTRAQKQAQALRNGAFDRFLELVQTSGHSSAEYLQNVVPTGEARHQALMLTIALSASLLQGRGAVRVHGGGFGGTAQAFVPLDELETFRSHVEAVLGAGSCHVLRIRPVGGVRIG